MTRLGADVLLTLAAGLLGVVALSTTLPADVQIDRDHAVVSILVLAVAGALVVARAAAHPFPQFGAANRVTTVRLALTAWLAGALVDTPSTALAWLIVAVGLVAVSLDGVDGWLARRTGLASAFGARFDMEVDALLILVLSVLVWSVERAGAWVLLSGLLRYAFVGAGHVWPWMAAPLPPRFRRRAICVVQIAGLIVALAPIVPPQGAVMAAALSLALLALSFAIDTLWLYRSHRREQVA